MEDESGIVETHRPRKPEVTNINIFALAPAGSPHAGVPEEASVPEPAPELDEDFGTRFVSTEWLERRNRKLVEMEQDLRRRAAELDARELELEQREAEFEAEVFIRSEALEEREQRLTELDVRLDRRETELGSWVARVQGGLRRADAL